MLKEFENDNIIINTKLHKFDYTYQILNETKEHNLFDDIYLIIGADNIIDFNKWKKYEEIIKYNLIIINRDNIDVEKYLKKYKIEKYIIINDLPLLNISSTKIRKLIKDKNKELDKYLYKETIDYIEEKNLYK